MKLRNIGIILILLGVTLFYPYANAEAGRYKTQWGMSLEEVKAALSGQVENLPSESTVSHPSTDKYISRYSVSGFLFSAVLSFNDKKQLDKVTLHYQGDGQYEFFSIYNG
jgi:hypothetical protein